ncbi:MAG: RecQ family ATP-dependent DNA helicase [Bullifex sp.]
MKDTDELIRKTAEEIFGIKSLRPLQKKITREIVSGFGKGPSSLLAVLPTGGGKSLCFQLPAYLASGITIIVYPIISLIRDQSSSLRKNGIQHEVLIGESSKEHFLLRVMSGDVKIIITNVESLANPLILSFLSSKKISMLVLDEVHTVISWGETFRPAYLEAKRIAAQLKPEQILAFTATLDGYTAKRLEELLFTEKPRIIRDNTDRPNIFYHRVRSLFPLQDCISILTPPERRPAVIFVRSRRRAEELTALLSGSFLTLCYHAGLPSEEKRSNEDIFFSSTEHVLCATVAYGMGVNASHIRTVIHYDLPEKASDFFQESGRAGRDGKPAESFTLLRKSAKGPLYSVFADKGCIRKRLLSMMGKNPETECSGCDGCEGIFTPAWGEDIIMKQVRRIPLRHTEHSLLRKLSMVKDFRNIQRAELRDAVRTLKSEKRIKSFMGHLYAVRKIE